MNSTELASMQWRKSSYSNGQANCIEVTTTQGEQARITIRDSKATDGPYLFVTARAWNYLIRNVEANLKW